MRKRGGLGRDGATNRRFVGRRRRRGIIGHVSIRKAVTSRLRILSRERDARTAQLDPRRDEESDVAGAIALGTGLTPPMPVHRGSCFHRAWTCRRAASREPAPCRDASVWHQTSQSLHAGRRPAIPLATAPVFRQTSATGRKWGAASRSPNSTMVSPL